MSDDRWTKRTTSWRGPDRKKSIGRPYARWPDNIKGVTGKWLEEGNNREKWTETEEAFTQKGLHSAGIPKDLMSQPSHSCPSSRKSKKKFILISKKKQTRGANIESDTVIRANFDTL
ncbi:hypothetical protein EVAR_69700_1 [Eumeta japonica]|uniref:Uncharacterized protein n=1 Tax=Eumeta variegata TaxID=151549 RepID=A0A4C1SEB1_EUMVA|nr:hypothetical protein EVAR_69700_1 [Eumeta japonica]